MPSIKIVNNNPGISSLKKQVTIMDKRRYNHYKQNRITPFFATERIILLRQQNFVNYIINTIHTMII